MNAREQQAFDLGWDFATFGLEVPDDANKLFCDGYRAFATNPRRRSRHPDRYCRKWLQTRYGALRRGKLYSSQVTPEYIKQIVPESGCCPVTGKQFTYSTSTPTDWSIDRANNDRGYIRGNIIVISQYVNEVKSDKSLEEIRLFAEADADIGGLSGNQWRKLAELIEPAFGDQEDGNPIQMLFGQPVALGMPASPVASFQAALSRVIIAGWNPDDRDDMAEMVGLIGRATCRTKGQLRAYLRLMREVVRRATHISDYWEIWATERVQKRLFKFISSLDGAGLCRLAQMQKEVFGRNNRNFF